MKNVLKYVIVLLIFSACNGASENQSAEKEKISCSGACCKKDGEENATLLTCKLTSPELQERKAGIIASLRNQVIDKKELENGFAYKFRGDDKTIDQLMEFTKSERQCCDFFHFNLEITGDTTAMWFEITGGKAVKEFIKSELEL